MYNFFLVKRSHTALFSKNQMLIYKSKLRFNFS